MPESDPKARILSAAGPVFAEQGFGAATVREICTAAGVNIAAVNYHFGDKETLYKEAVSEAHRLKVQQAPLPDWPSNMPPEEKLRIYISNFLARLLDVDAAPWQTRLMMREILQPTSAVQALVEDYFRPHFERLLAILDELLAPETPQHIRHKIGFSIVGQCVHYRVGAVINTLILDEDEQRAHFQTSALAEHIAKFSLAAIAEYCHPASAATR